MKKAFRTIPFVIVIATILLAGCSMGGETATIVLNLGRDEIAKAVSLSEVNHEIALSGPTGSRTANIGPGGGSATFTVAPGTWNISVTGYYQGQVYATGSATTDVVAGRTTSVSVQMTVVYVEAPVPPATKPLLSSVITATRMETPSTYTSPYVCSPGDTIRAYIETAGILRTEDLTWTWKVATGYINGVPIPANLISSNNEYIVDANDVHKEIWATGTHPNYSGDIRTIVRVCEALDTSNWANFSSGIAAGNDPLYPVDGYYVLTNDITVTNSIVGGGYPGDPYFRGYFDGNGKTIDLTLNTVPPHYEYVGLFTRIGGQVANLNLNAEISISSTIIANGTYLAGAVAGNNLGDISNVSVTLTSAGINISNSGTSFTACSGGIVGVNQGAIYTCSVENNQVIASGDPSSTTFAGGIVGWNRYGKIYYCYADTFANAVGNGWSGAGGIAGTNTSAEEALIENCVFLRGTINGINAGRIWGSDSDANGNSDPGVGRGNYGSDIVLVYEGGTQLTPITGTLTSKHGLEFIGSAADEDWWKTTAGWANVWEGAYDFAPWYWGNSAKPTLWFN